MNDLCIEVVFLVLENLDFETLKSYAFTNKYNLEAVKTFISDKIKKFKSIADDQNLDFEYYHGRVIFKDNLALSVIFHLNDGLNSSLSEIKYLSIDDSDHANYDYDKCGYKFGKNSMVFYNMARRQSWHKNHDFMIDNNSSNYHRIDGPALLIWDDLKREKYTILEWRIDKLLHRTNDPASIYREGRQITYIWYQKGIKHRLNGPAWHTNTGQQEYFYEGHPCEKSLYYLLLSMNRRMESLENKIATICGKRIKNDFEF